MEREWLPLGVVRRRPGVIVADAPGDAAYALVTASDELSAGRVITAGANVTVTDGGAGSTVTIASTGGGGGGGGTPCGWQFNDSANSSHALLTCMD